MQDEATQEMANRLRRACAHLLARTLLLALVAVVGFGCAYDLDEDDVGGSDTLNGGQDRDIGVSLDSSQHLDADEADGETARDTGRPDSDTSVDVDLPDVEVAPTCQACVGPHAQVTEGLTMVHFDLNMSRVDADPLFYAPLVWGSPSATGGDRQSLVGTLPAPGWLGVIGEGRVVAWAGHEGAFEVEEDGRADNDAFRQRLISWLLDGGSRLGATTGHAEWFTDAGLSTALLTWMASQGTALTAIAGPLDAATLSGYDALIVGNPWGDFNNAELVVLETWVRGGGGLLVLGLGWSWSAYNDVPSTHYPVNRIGERLGFRAVNGSIRDPDAPAGTAETPAYLVRPLSEYTPRNVVVLRASETDVNRVKGRALAAPGSTFVIEGQHMGLQLPTADWALLDDPADALDALDRLYVAELGLTSGVNPPFGGDVVWIVSQDDPDALWWMHSGNPIVYQAAASTAEIIPHFNAEGHPGWGIAHEQGHNMHAGSCGDLFVPAGTAESWTNVFGLWSYRENGWSFAPQMGDLFAVGHDYHAQANPDFQELLADPFILLGCLEMIWSYHGWDGMKGFMTKAATDTLAGIQAGDDAARIAYFVEELSHAYGIDFAPLISHWGFEVSAVSAGITGVYPPSDL